MACQQRLITLLILMSIEIASITVVGSTDYLIRRESSWTRRYSDVDLNGEESELEFCLCAGNKWPVSYIFEWDALTHLYNARIPKRPLKSTSSVSDRGHRQPTLSFADQTQCHLISQPSPLIRLSTRSSSPHAPRGAQQKNRKTHLSPCWIQVLGKKCLRVRGKYAD